MRLSNPFLGASMMGCTLVFCLEEHKMVLLLLSIVGSLPAHNTISHLYFAAVAGALCWCIRSRLVFPTITENRIYMCGFASFAMLELIRGSQEAGLFDISKPFTLLSMGVGALLGYFVFEHTLN